MTDKHSDTSALPSTARVVIIGGGIAGCSTLYHLTQAGWTDVLLIERDELTSGSTWHAAAQVTQFGANQTMVALKRHSIELYKKLSADPEHPVSYHITGGMRLAHTQDQVDTYRHYIDMAAGVNVDMEYIDAAEVHKRHPLINPGGLLGAWWDPLDGDIDPAGITFAMARCARAAGAKVSRFNPVTDITREANGEFTVQTKLGNVRCEKVVNACGYRVNEVGNMLGVQHPVTSMEHMYFLTEPMPELEALNFRVPIIRDPGDDFYSRQEKQGLLVGVYEQQCKTFGLEGIEPSFTQALCPSDLDRCLDNMERIFQRLPALENAGIHTVINGPITYTIDGAPLIGPVPGIENAYCAIGLRAGIGESGGHGKILAEIITEGEPEWDSWFLDPRRFTQYANTETTCLKAIEDYQNEFHYHLPHEFRPAARLARTTSLYPVLSQKHCDWGVVNGWERALYFKPDASFSDVPGYRFNATMDIVRKEVEELQSGVSIMEVSGFNRYAISGPGAEVFLDSVSCSRIPETNGKIRLCYLLTEKGNVLSEATIARIEDHHYWFGSAAAAEWHDRDWLLKYMPDNVKLHELTSHYTALVVAGPKSREFLQSLAPRSDFSNAAFGQMHVRQVHIGHCEVIAMRVSFSGELGYELHVRNEQLYLLWQLLHPANCPFSPGDFGLYATESMRIEKGYRHWKSDLLVEFDPYESGLERFVTPDKPGFVGKQALLQKGSEGRKKTFVSLHIDCDFACAHSGSPMFSADGQIGTITSAAFGHRVKKNIAMGFINESHSAIGTKLEVGVLGTRYTAVVAAADCYDPENTRLKA